MLYQRFSPAFENSTNEEIAAFHAKLKAKGVTGYVVSPIYMKSEADIDNAFEYAKRVGVKLIVGVPNYELLPYLDKKVKEYGFNYAIHLHGPDIATYPDAEDVWNHVKDLDPRIGMCLDIGHDTRNGKDAMTDPFMGIAESIGYFRGVIATTKK